MVVITGDMSGDKDQNGRAPEKTQYVLTNVKGIVKQWVSVTLGNS